MDRTLIVAFGNSLRGDDALGPLAARRLREIVSAPGVEILELHQLTPELAEPVSRASQVIFIDACEGSDAGAIHDRRVTVEAAPGSSFTHHATPEGLLAAARALYGCAPEGCIITVTGGDFSFSLDPSPELLERVEKVVSLVLRKLASP